MTLSIKIQAKMTFSINNNQLKTLRIECFYAERHYAECRDLFIAMLNVVMLSVVMLNVVMLNVVMLNVVMLNVVTPFTEHLCKLLTFNIWVGPENPY